MKWNLFREISRKVIHLLMLVILLFYIVFEKKYNKTYALLALILLLLFFLIIEYIRLDLDIKIPLVGFFIRPKEINKMSGVIYFIIASIICLAVFDFGIALASLLMTTLGDMTAAIAGQKYGHTMVFKKKTLIGGVAELVVNIIIGVGIVLFFSNITIYTMLAMAFTATIIEIVVESIDDNLVVPLATGFIGQILLLM